MEEMRQGEGLTKRFKAMGPTTRADGTPLAVSEISHYVRSVSLDGGAVEEMDVQLVEDANTPEYDGEFDEEVDIDFIASGTWTYTYRTVDTGGRRSVESEPAVLVVLPPFANPNPPTQVG